MTRPTAIALALLSALALPAFAKVPPDEFTAACAAGGKAKVEMLLSALPVSPYEAQSFLPRLMRATATPKQTAAMAHIQSHIAD